MTSSEDYYPTVAINALMRVLRDSGLASQHQVGVCGGRGGTGGGLCVYTWGITQGAAGETGRCDRVKKLLELCVGVGGGWEDCLGPVAGTHQQVNACAAFVCVFVCVRDVRENGTV